MSGQAGPAIDDYEEMIRFLYGFERFGILLGLENIQAMLDGIGAPQHRFHAVHVAGSNGKGSTSAYIERILRESGGRTALYTSPHLNDFRERIRLNGRLVGKEALLKAVEKIKPVYNPDRTTFFEYTTAAAFDIIAEFNPDVAVIETGLGGRLDATNTVSPLVTVITDVSLEHEEYLGSTRAEIAAEKAGIMKPGIPVITGASRKDAARVIAETAARFACPLRRFGREFKIRRTGLRSFDYEGVHRRIADIVLSMPGAHQFKNAALAVATIESLGEKGFAVSDEEIRRAVHATRFPGRFETLAENPTVIIDGAHTPEGMRMLRSTFRSMYPGESPLFLLGVLQDKRYEEMIRIAASFARRMICAPPQGYRALDPEHAASLARSHGIPATAAVSIEDGFRILRSEAGETDRIIAAGSLYMIGPVRSACGVGDE